MRDGKRYSMQMETKREPRQQYLHQTKQTKTKIVARDKEAYYIIINGSIQEDLTITNTQALNIGAHKYIKERFTDTKEETDSNTVIVGDFHTPLTSVDRSPRQKTTRKPGLK